MMSDKDEERAMERDAGRKETLSSAVTRKLREMTPFVRVNTGGNLPWEPPVVTFDQPEDLEMTDMGRAYGTYSAFRAQGWTDDQMLTYGYARRRAQPTESGIYQHAAELAALARKMGFIVTIEQVSDQPPAMGKHHDVVTVREVRK